MCAPQAWSIGLEKQGAHVRRRLSIRKEAGGRMARGKGGKKTQTALLDKTSYQPLQCRQVAQGNG